MLYQLLKINKINSSDENVDGAEHNFGGCRSFKQYVQQPLILCQCS